MPEGSTPSRNGCRPQLLSVWHVVPLMPLPSPRPTINPSRYAEAERWFKEALAHAQLGFPPGDPHIPSAMHYLAELYRNTGQLDKAEPLYRQVRPVGFTGSAASQEGVEACGCWPCCDSALVLELWNCSCAASTLTRQHPADHCGAVRLAW
jgi:hypothetical protein